MVKVSTIANNRDKSRLVRVSSAVAASPAPVFRSADYGQFYTSAAPASPPAGTIAGDFLIAIGYAFGANPTMLYDGTQTWTLVATVSASPGLKVWWAINNGGLDYIQIDCTGTNTRTAALIAYTGVNPTTPMDVTPTVSGPSIGENFSVPTITTVTANALRVVIAGANDDTATHVSRLTFPGTHATRFNTSGNLNASLGASDITQAVAGASPSETVVQSDATNTLMAVAHLALRPA